MCYITVKIRTKKESSNKNNGIIPIKMINIKILIKRQYRKY